MRSVLSSPSLRRAVCTACSKRFMLTWRKAVAKESSILLVSIARRTSGLSSRASRSWKTSISPKTDAVSAVVSGVSACNSPCAAASFWWTPWPSSCAKVITSRGLAS